jgi:hypothetical protein
MYSKGRDGKSKYTYFATIDQNGDHAVYLSAYGDLASKLLERYIEGHRDDYEGLFAKWDKSVEKAKSQIGFSVSHEVEGGYICVSSFQDGIGIPSEGQKT